MKRSLFLRCAGVAAPVPPRKIQIAVVGSGPSGCYVADYLTKKDPLIHVDIFERMPVPFGLVRYGVAPDHPEVKNVQGKFLEMFQSGRVSWVGNIEVGAGIPLAVMMDAYTAVVIATGGADSDQPLSIPGEDLGNVISARSFVNYYNTFPVPYGSSPKYAPFNAAETRDVVIIGNGNVAIDVARVVGTTYKHWCPTDMNAYAIKELMTSTVQHISVVGRRSVEHSAFSIAEFRELANVQKDFLKVSVEPFNLPEVLQRAEQTRAKKRLFELVHQFTSEVEESIPAVLDRKGRIRPGVGGRSLRFRYSLKPLEFLRHPEKRNVVGSVLFEKQHPLKPPEQIILPCDVAIKSVGYRAGPGIKGVPSDDRGLIPNSGGRVINTTRLYCAGWAKTGPKGVILHSMTDGHATASTILNDLANKLIVPQENHTGKFALLEWMVVKKLVPMSVQGLERILFVEREKGVDMGKAAEKIHSTTDMMDLALGGKLAKRANDRVRGIQSGRPDALLYLGEFLDEDTDMSSLAEKLAREMPRAIALESGLHDDQM